MQTIADVSVDQILCFLMAFTRIATMMAVFPVLGSRNTPGMAKAGFALILAIILFPLIPPKAVALPTGLFSFTVIVAKEVLVGLVLGFAGSLIFAIVQFGGKILDQEMAFAITDTFDPVMETESTAMASFFIVIFTIVLLFIGGHRMFIEALAKSFEVINVGEVHFASGPVSRHLITMTADIFVLGLKFAAPVITSLILTTVVLGIIARTMPQINIFIVGLPLKIGMGFIILIICLPSLNVMFERMVLAMQRDIYILIKLMG